MAKINNMVCVLWMKLYCRRRRRIHSSISLSRALSLHAAPTIFAFADQLQNFSHSHERQPAGGEGEAYQSALPVIVYLQVNKKRSSPSVFYIQYKYIYMPNIIIKSSAFRELESLILAAIGVHANFAHCRIRARLSPSERLFSFYCMQLLMAFKQLSDGELGCRG